MGVDGNSEKGIFGKARKFKRNSKTIARNAVMAVGVIASADQAANTIINPLQPIDTGVSVGRDFAGVVRAGIVEAADLSNPYLSSSIDLKKPDVTIESLNQTQAVEVQPGETNFQIAFPSLEGEVSLKAIANVGDAKATLDKYYDKEISANVYLYESLIREKAKKYGVPEDLFLAQVMIESKGDKDAVSKTGAVGLTQVMPQYAEELNLVVNDEVDERKIPERILEESAKKLRKLHDDEGTWAGAFQEWHMGIKNYDDLKKIVLAKRGIYMPNILVSPKDSTPEAQVQATEEAGEAIKIYRYFTIVEKLSPFLVFQDSDVAEEVSDPSWDGTTDYLPLMIAAIDKYNEDKPQVAPISPTGEIQEQGKMLVFPQFGPKLKKAA